MDSDDQANCAKPAAPWQLQPRLRCRQCSPVAAVAAAAAAEDRLHPSGRSSAPCLDHQDKLLRRSQAANQELRLEPPKRPPILNQGCLRRHLRSQRLGLTALRHLDQQDRAVAALRVHRATSANASLVSTDPCTEVSASQTFPIQSPTCLITQHQT